MRSGRFASFADFWPFYLSQHSRRMTRALHFAGTNAAVVLMVMAAWRRNAWLLLVGLGVVYGLAWIGHFFVEHNRPATFRYPLWSFAGDWKMWALTWNGHLRRELRRHGIADL